MKRHCDTSDWSRIVSLNNLLNELQGFAQKIKQMFTRTKSRALISRLDYDPYTKWSECSDSELRGVIVGPDYDAEEVSTVTLLFASIFIEEL